MNYPLDVEICVNAFTETGRQSNAGIQFLRAYVSVLNGIYKEGLNNPIADSIEVFKIKSNESKIRECFKEYYEEFLIQAKDAFRQGQLDSTKSAIGDTIRSFIDIGLIQENGGTYHA